MKTKLVINDAHIPFHDPKTLDLVYNFVREFCPDEIWINGDWADFYGVSKFNKNPSRRENFQDDLDVTIDELEKLRRAAPNARIRYKEGNHEFRLQRFLWRDAPELASLRDLTVAGQLKLQKLNIEYYPSDVDVEDEGMFQIVHGDLISKHSGWTAKAHYDKYGGSGICGHSHRGGSYLVAKRHDTHGWWENYCLCDLEPEYVKSPNWQQGFSIIHFAKDRFFVESIPIVGHRFVAQGKYFTWKKKGQLV